MTTHTPVSVRRAELIAYVLSAAVEESGCAYWAEARRIKRTKAANRHGYTDITSFEIRDAGFEGPREKKEWTFIDAAAIERGVQLLLSGAVEVRRDLAAQFVGNDWDYDSDGIDVLIQAIVFGKLVYG